MYRQKTRQDPDIRDKEKQKDMVHRQRTRQDPDIRDKEKQKGKVYRHNNRLDPKVIDKEKQQRSKYISQKQGKLANIDIVMFKNECKQLPCYVCAICYRQIFRKQVKGFLVLKHVHAFPV